jgi:phosphate uptake regulator
MAHLTIDVPEELAEPLRRQLRRAHDGCVAALRRALDAYQDGHGDLDALEGALVELRDLDGALAQLSRPAPAAVTAHPEVLADAVGALLAARPEDGALRALARVVDG